MKIEYIGLFFLLVIVGVIVAVKKGVFSLNGNTGKFDDSVQKKNGSNNTDSNSSGSKFKELVFAEYMTKNPMSLPNKWQDIKVNVIDYLNVNDNKIELKAFNNWIRTFNLKKGWGMPNPLTGGLTVIPTPIALIRFTYVDTKGVIKKREFKYGQKINLN